MYMISNGIGKNTKENIGEKVRNIQIVITERGKRQYQGDGLKKKEY